MVKCCLAFIKRQYVGKDSKDIESRVMNIKQQTYVTILFFKFVWSALCNTYKVLVGKMFAYWTLKQKKSCYGKGSFNIFQRMKQKLWGSDSNHFNYVCHRQNWLYKRKKTFLCIFYVTSRIIIWTRIELLGAPPVKQYTSILYI